MLNKVTTTVSSSRIQNVYYLIMYEVKSFIIRNIHNSLQSRHCQGSLINFTIIKDNLKPLIIFQATNPHLIIRVNVFYLSVRFRASLLINRHEEKLIQMFVN